VAKTKTSKKSKAKKQYSYHFSLGDSSKGPVGYCARIVATSPKKAVELLREIIAEEQEVDKCGTDAQNDKCEYIEAYFNPGAITVADIDEVNEVDERGHE
jgi:hypothetical protein